MLTAILMLAYACKRSAPLFGSHPSNDIVFPDKAPPFIGTITLKDEVAHIQVNKEAELNYQNERHLNEYQEVYL